MASLHRVTIDRGAMRALALTAICYGILIFARLEFHHFDSSFFVTAGSTFCTPSLAPEGLTVDTKYGYDGQFYYRLALNPFTTQATAHGITLDNPPLRQQRILYPILAGALAMGRANLVPWTMILVNYLAICGLGYVAARFAQAFGRDPLWGLAIPFYPGLLLSLARDLTDVLAISLMLTSLYLLYRRRVAFGACILALAALTRETTVLLPGVLFAVSFWRALRRQTDWTECVYMTIPLGVFAAWQLWIFAIWGPSGAINSNLQGLPLKPAIILFERAIQLARDHPTLLLAELSTLAGTIALVMVALYRSRIDLGVKLAWIGYLVLASMLTGAIWIEDWAFMRATNELMVLGFVILLSSPYSILIRVALAPTLAIWAVLACRAVYEH